MRKSKTKKKEKDKSNDAESDPIIDLYNKVHPTELTPIKTVPIDVDIIPVVNWLNSFGGIKTLYCCQGEDDPKASNDIPYILFTSDYDIDLVKVLMTVQAFSGNFSEDMGVEIDYLNSKISMRYNMIWKNKIVLKRFSKFVKENTFEEIEEVAKQHEKELRVAIFHRAEWKSDLL